MVAVLTYGDIIFLTLTVGPALYLMIKGVQ